MDDAFASCGGVAQLLHGDFFQGDVIAAFKLFRRESMLVEVDNRYRFGGNVGFGLIEMSDIQAFKKGFGDAFR
jgi:hypothetical protein